jgi:hypothetical protein
MLPPKVSKDNRELEGLNLQRMLENVSLEELQAAQELAALTENETIIYVLKAVLTAKEVRKLVQLRMF